MTDNTISPPIREHGEGVRKRLHKALDDDMGHLTDAQSLSGPYALRRVKEAIDRALSAQPVNWVRGREDAAVREDWWKDTSAQPVKDAVREAHKPPAHWTGAGHFKRHPATAEEWNELGREGKVVERAIKRLQFAGDLADPDAPDQMAIVHRGDIIDVLHELIWRTAQSENRRERLAALSPKSPASVGLDPASDWQPIETAPFERMVMVACDRFKVVAEAIQYHSGGWTTFGANGPFACRPYLWREKPSLPALTPEDRP